MPVVVLSCPSCRKKFGIAPASLGGPVACSHCHANMMTAAPLSETRSARAEGTVKQIAEEACNRPADKHSIKPDAGTRRTTDDLARRLRVTVPFVWGQVRAIVRRFIAAILAKKACSDCGALVSVWQRDLASGYCRNCRRRIHEEQRQRIREEQDRARQQSTGALQEFCVVLPATSPQLVPGASDQEQVLFQDAGCLVTNARFVYENRTFAMHNVTSIRKGFDSAARDTTGGGAIICGLLSMAAFFWWGTPVLGVISTFAGIVLAMIAFATKPLHIVFLTSTAKEVAALRSTDQRRVERIIDALNLAIVHSVHRSAPVADMPPPQGPYPFHNPPADA